MPNVDAPPGPVFMTISVKECAALWFQRRGRETMHNIRKQETGNNTHYSTYTQGHGVATQQSRNPSSERKDFLPCYC